MRANGLVLATALIAALGCSAETVEPGTESGAVEQVDVGQSVRLRVGQTAAVRGTSVQLAFRSVPSDSRCPIDAICVWQGDAQVRLDVTEGRRAWRETSLHTGQEPRSVEVGGYSIRLTEVAPAPVSTDSTRQRDYTIALEITRR